MREYTERKILITGGASGIGNALVNTFLSKGAQVFFTYHSSEEKAKEMMSMEPRYSDATVSYTHLDVYKRQIIGFRKNFFRNTILEQWKR